MKKFNLSVIAFIIFSCFAAPVFSQWTQKQSMGGIPRSFATGFSIGDTAYVVGGYDGNGVLFEDVWAYDRTNDTWTQKGNFAGGFRSGATAFTVNGKAYFGTGADGSS